MSDVCAKTLAEQRSIEARVGKGISSYKLRPSATRTQHPVHLSTHNFNYPSVDTRGLMVFLDMSFMNTSAGEGYVFAF